MNTTTAACEWSAMSQSVILNPVTVMAALHGDMKNKTASVSFDLANGLCDTDERTVQKVLSNAAVNAMMHNKTFQVTASGLLIPSSELQIADATTVLAVQRIDGR